MASTTQRGYGWTHQRLRAQLIATYNPASPCWRCGYALGPVPQLLHLGHVDGDRSKYAGLEHAWCSTSAGGRLGRRRQQQPPAPSPRSRKW